MNFRMESANHSENGPVLRLVGSLDVTNAREVQAELDRIRSARNIGGVTLDLSLLHVLDSISLGIIIHSFTFFQAEKRPFVIRNPSEEIFELLQISCLDQLIPIERTSL